MDKVKIGVFGVGRGSSMMKYCSESEHAELVAICDKWEEGLNRKKKELDNDKITYYTSFDEFIKHDMDAVVLANYATEHTPYAIKCLKSGKHVLSEVLPVQTMKEAVELVEAVESSDKIYAYAENYCYMPAPKEMKKLYNEGVLGEFEYGEGEYMHNCESIWHSITQGNPDHWRNNICATYYCTHSIGPLIHITGLRPIKVVGFEMPFNARTARCGAKSGHSAVEMITLENGAILKSIHGLGCSKDSIWYSIYGTKGRLESAREDADPDAYLKLYTNLDEFEGENAHRINSYLPADEYSEKAKAFGHGYADYYVMYNFIEKIRGNNDTDVIDVYEALDMFLPGLFAYRSVLNGGIPMDIPNLRDKTVREYFRHDTACTDKNIAGEQFIPSYSKGNPMIPNEQYELIKQKWLKSLEEKE